MHLKSISQLCMLFALLSFMSCQNVSSDKQTNALQETQLEQVVPAVQTLNSKVDPPFENIDVAYQEFTLDQQQARTITLDNGSSIEIPAQAFVAKDGTPIKTAVTIQYREFHSPAEIISSGIPMHLTNEAGETEWMQSAGMFEIKGFSEGQEVFIAQDKELTVDMASNVDGVYDFWYLDQEQNNWAQQGDTGSAATLSNRALKSSPSRPIKPVAFDENKPSLNFDLNYDAFPELKDLQGFVWQYAGTDREEDPTNNEWIFNETWTDIQLDRAHNTGVYQLNLSSDEREYSIPVRPSLKGLDYESSMTKYKRELALYQAQVNLRNEQAAFVRQMRINNFGIYNYDIMWKAQNAIPLYADFDFGDFPEEFKELITVYLITGDRRAVISYPNYNWKRFRFDPNQDNQLMAILPGNLIATFSQEDFNEQMSALKASSKKEYQFKMTIKDRPVESLAQVDQAIL